MSSVLTRSYKSTAKLTESSIPREPACPQNLSFTFAWHSPLSTRRLHREMLASPCQHCMELQHLPTYLQCQQKWIVEFQIKSQVIYITAEARNTNVEYVSLASRQLFISNYLPQGPWSQHVALPQWGQEAMQRAWGSAQTHGKHATIWMQAVIANPSPKTCRQSAKPQEPPESMAALHWANFTLSKLYIYNYISEQTHCCCQQCFLQDCRGLGTESWDVAV